ncbi:MAG: CRTAC1 family protein [Pseudomonadota bacterium]
MRPGTLTTAVYLAACAAYPFAANADWFEDATGTAGIAFDHVNGATGDFWFPEIMGGGAAILDYDGDGRYDVYLVQSGDIGPAVDQSGRKAGDRLLRNVTEKGGAMRFEDVTERARIDARGYGQGVAVGDYDGDGDADIYVLNFGPNQLWRNNGDGTFEDVTKQAGVGDPGWGVSAAFADLDGDALPELFVVNYVDYQFDTHRECRAAGSSRRDYCSPSVYPFNRDTLYHNRGDGRFEDISEAAGVADDPQPGLGVVTADFNDDGHIDVYVANDGEPNHFWLNQGDLTFIDDALLAGNAVNAAGSAEAGMGVDAGDFDRNGALDLFVTHLVRETNTLYANDGTGWFSDVSAQSGVGAPSLPKTAFGTAFVDLDLDGWLDLFVVNGGVTIEADLAATDDPFPYHQTDQVFANRQGRFVDVTADAGRVLTESHVGRGAAFGDLDNDGLVDAVAANNNGPAKLLRNVAGTGQAWLGLELVDAEGRTQVHATVWLLGDDGSDLWLHRARTDGSYASASDSRVVLGLGATAGAQSVRVIWPDGASERFDELTPNRYHRLQRGDGS